MCPEARCLSGMSSHLHARAVCLRHGICGATTFCQRLVSITTLSPWPQHAIPCRLLLAGVVGVLPAPRLGDVAGVLSAMLKAPGGPQEGLAWLAAACSVLPDSAVPPNDKEALMGERNGPTITA